MNVARIFVIFACLFFGFRALADDAADQRAIFDYTVKNSPDCTRPIDVAQSIILQDGQVVYRNPNGQAVIRDPATISEMRENLPLLNQVENCITRVNNAMEQHNLSPTLANKLKKSAIRFMQVIAKTVKANKNPRVEAMNMLGVRG